MTIRIIVCIKSVVKAAPRGIAKRTPDNSELNPFDRPALEAALQLRESMGGSVTALCMGPAVGTETLAEAMAMGVDEAILISDRALAESDTLVTSRVLAAAIEKTGGFDLVFFGTRTSDSDTGQVGPQTAACLDIPFVSGVKSMEPASGKWVMQRTMDDWEEVWQVKPPAATSISARAYHPRPLSLAHIARVFDQPTIRQWSLADLGLAPGDVGLSGSPTRVAALKPIKRNRQCRMIEGETLAKADALMEQLTLKGAIGS